MNLADNDFVLFGLPERFALERGDLDQRWRRLQASAHPDRFAAEGASAQRVAMQWSVRINEAYRRLREPLLRASYLCALRGAPVEAESNTAMPPSFLMQQMNWREALDDARGDVAGLERLDEEVRTAEQSLLADIARALDEDAAPQRAAQDVRALMFVHKFRKDLADRLAAIDG